MLRSLVLAGLLIPAMASAGKKKPKVDPDHANHFKDVEPAGTDIKIGVADAWARDLETKMKVQIVNETADYVLWDTQQTSFDYGEMQAVPKAGLRGRYLVLEPKASGSRVLNAKGVGMHKDSIVFVPGGLSLVPKNAPVREAPDFQLPLSTPDVEAGNFKCTVPGKIKKETDETVVKFRCRYEGEGIGVLSPAQIQVRLEDGQVFASDKRPEPTVMQPGDEVKFAVEYHVSARIVDMQFATMHLVFNKAFREGEPRPMEAAPITLELDPGLTAAKND